MQNGEPHHCCQAQLEPADPSGRERWDYLLRICLAWDSLGAGDLTRGHVFSICSIGCPSELALLGLHIYKRISAWLCEVICIKFQGKSGAGDLAEQLKECFLFLERTWV